MLIITVKTHHWDIPVPLEYEIYGPSIERIKAALQSCVDDCYFSKMHQFELLSLCWIPDDTDMTDFPSIKAWDRLS